MACDGGFVTLVDMILPGKGLLGNRSHAWLDTVASFGLEYERALGPAGHLKDEAGWLGRELAARPAVDPGSGRAAVPCVPVPEASQTWKSYSTASRPGSLQIPGASVLAQNGRGASGRSRAGGVPRAGGA